LDLDLELEALTVPLADLQFMEMETDLELTGRLVVVERLEQESLLGQVEAVELGDQMGAAYTFKSVARSHSQDIFLLTALKGEMVEVVA
jgi:hypothetical protein